MRLRSAAVSMICTALVGIPGVPITPGTPGASLERPVPPRAQGGGITCNEVPAAQLSGCVSRMLTDPRSPYSSAHVRTEDEKRPMATLMAAAAGGGSWSVVADCRVGGYKVNPIHASLTRTGKVLMTAGSGYSKANFRMKVFKAWIWDPAKPRTCPHEVPMPAKDLFCSGHSHLPDGRILFFGGTSRYGRVDGVGYTGVREAYVFDDSIERFVQIESMYAARWYPNGPVNAAGEPVVIGGLDAISRLTPVNEIYDPDSGEWSTLPGRRTFPMYAGMTLARTGDLCYTGTYFAGRAGVNPMCWNWRNNTSRPLPGMPRPDCRDQAGSLLLYPAQAQKVLVVGGGCAKGVTGTTATIGLAAKRPAFHPGPHLGFAAMHVCAAVLPDGSAFVAGGGDHNTRPRLAAARLAQGARHWQRLASPRVPRMYHSTCLLLPDGSVVTMGTNAGSGTVESRFEVYRPWYMQPRVSRPAITKAPSAVRCGASYQASYRGPAAITQASLARLGSVTHSTDPNQRMVALTVRRIRPGQVRLTVPGVRALTPPGYYLLSLKDSRGVPSRSALVRVLCETSCC